MFMVGIGLGITIAVLVGVVEILYVIIEGTYEHFFDKKKKWVFDQDRIRNLSH